MERLKAVDLVPVVRSLVISELSVFREPWGVRQAAKEWTPDTTLDEVGAGLDSLALLSLAGRVAGQVDFGALGTEDYLPARRRLIDWAELIAHTWTHVKRPCMKFTSSGTTGAGVVKSVTHSLAALEEEAATFLTILPAARAVAAYVPAHHIYGFLFTVMMPAMERVPVIESYLNPIVFRPPPGTRIVSFPDHWRVAVGQRAVADRRGSSRGAAVQPAGGAGTAEADSGSSDDPETHEISSTAPMAPDLARVVRSRMPLVEIYGATETAGVGYRDVTDGPYTLLQYWVRDNADPQVIQRIVPGSQVSVRLMDRIEWFDEREFLPHGRLDNVVQVGGHNVDPDAVAARIREHPLVADSAVRLMTPHEGTRLKAFVVPDEGGSGARDGDPDADRHGELRRELEEWVRVRLPAHERPGHFTLGPALPRTEMGKLADWSIDRSD